MFIIFLFSEFLASLVFGLTATVVQLETMRHVSDTIFASTIIIASFSSWFATKICVRKEIRDWVWKKRNLIIILDILIALVIALVTEISYDLRILGLATIAVFSSSLLSLFWESFKEIKQNGTELQIKKSNKENAGYFIGASLYLLLTNLGLDITVSIALISQVLIVLLSNLIFTLLLKENC
jgi:hypothetical protein